MGAQYLDQLLRRARRVADGPHRGWLNHASAQLPECRLFMHRHMIGLVALDLVLRGIRAGVPCAAHEFGVSCVHAGDVTADPPCFRVPADVIAHFVLMANGASVSSFGTASDSHLPTKI